VRNEPGRVTKGPSAQDPHTAITLQAAALLLAYPEAELLDRLEVLESALRDTPAVEQFAPVLAHLHGETLPEEAREERASHHEGASLLSHLQAFHVQEFDLSRRHALHLSYWTDGDTRRRGEVLAEVKQVYRESGLVVDLSGELPDYLPMVLEFAAADPGRGLALLQRFRASLELIRLGLEKDALPHAGVLTAICALLPGPSPRTRAEVQAQFGEVQPVEFVGLNDVVRS
jgi:nitrate reductase delta subunit